MTEKPRGFSRTWIDHSCDVDADVDTLWALLSDVDAWSTWTPGLIAIRRRDPRPVQVGSRFRMVLALRGLPRFTLPAKMFTLEQPRRIEWGGGMPGSIIRHRFELEALSARRTRLRHVEYATGLLALLSMPIEKSIYAHDRRWSDAIVTRFADGALGLAG